MFFRRPYVGRLWILQELLLSSPETMIYCGSSEMQWPVLRQAIVCPVTKVWTHVELRRTLDFVRPLIYHYEDVSISFIMATSRTRKCRDPRDKIYDRKSRIQVGRQGQLQYRGLFTTGASLQQRLFGVLFS